MRADWKLIAVLSHEACRVRANDTMGFEDMYLCGLLAEFDGKGGMVYLKLSSCWLFWSNTCLFMFLFLFMLRVRITRVCDPGAVRNAVILVVYHCSMDRGIPNFTIKVSDASRILGTTDK
jgi:hypothetical protein